MENDLNFEVFLFFYGLKYFNVVKRFLFLDGRFKFMPEFKEARSFPRACDSLKQFSLKQFGNHLFVALEPDFDFNAVIEGMSERIGFLPLNDDLYKIP